MTKDVESDLKEVLYIIKSHPEMGHIGMAERLELFDKRLDKIENRHKVIYRVSVVLSAVFGGIITWVVKLKAFA